MSYVKSLKCRECGAEFPVAPRAICEECFGPLEVTYDYAALRRSFGPDAIAGRARSMWRYRELLPVDGGDILGLEVGCTPLVRADRLARTLGVDELYVKNDAVNFPTLSFKDRVVSVALTKAREFGMTTVGCASTGNLANAVASQGVRHGFETCILVPEDLEAAKILGTTVYGARLVGVRGDYDQVNRLCSQIADRFGWGIVNVNLRPFYGEGSKTVGYEIAEQLGWKLPASLVCCMAGGSLLTKIGKAFDELRLLDIIDDGPTRLYGAQARGCNPIVAAVQDGTGEIRPVKARTIARSLAIGNPADGYYAARAIRESGGWAEDVTDDEIVEGIRLLAGTEGIFAETAGGVTVAAARKLIASGRIERHEPIVLVITGNGLKTTDALAATAPAYPVIEPRLEAFEGVLAATAADRSGSVATGAFPSSGRSAPAAPLSSIRTL
ncbi:MAG TPA: threonine synthase [Candidatus Polarisedimenticolia bacterium]|jgi:threonine synthase|nr:threonine synthase [Candidatus Polarisedimenticolia bacterium]